MTETPTPEQELRLLDQELRQLDARRGQLLARRAWLLSLLAGPQGLARQFGAPGPGPAAALPPYPAQHGPRPPGSGWSAAPGAGRPLFGPPQNPAANWPSTPGGWAPRHPVHPAARRSGAGPEASGPRIQNLLLLFGGLLLTVAALAFTLVSWGHMGLGPRAAVLGLVTLAALGTPALLLRRRLRSTAEALAALGLALTLLDTYALHRTVFPDVAGTPYAAVSLTLLSGIWAAYGRTLGALRHPLPAAVVLAQLPLPLWALHASAGPWAWAWLLLLTAAADLALTLFAGIRSVRLAAGISATAAFLGTVSLAAQLSADATGPGQAIGAAVLLGAAAALALAAARHSAPLGLPIPLSAIAALLTTAAAGGILRTLLPQDWAMPGYLLCALLIAAGAGLTYTAAPGTTEPTPASTAPPGPTPPAPAPAGPSAPTPPAPAPTGPPVPTAPAPAPAAPTPPASAPVHASLAVLRQGFLAGTAAVMALAAVWALPAGLYGLASPLRLAGEVWQGEGAAAPDRGPEEPGALPALVVLALLGLFALLVDRLAEGAPRPLRAAAGPAALGCLWLALYCLPEGAQLPYAVVLLSQLALTVGLLLASARVRPFPLAATSLACAVLSSLSAAFLSLADKPWTLATLAALTALYASASTPALYAALSIPAPDTATSASDPQAADSSPGSHATGSTSGLYATASTPAHRPALLRPLAVSCALASATAFLVASGYAANWRPEHTALLVLLVPAVAVLLSSLLAGEAAAAGASATAPGKAAAPLPGRSAARLAAEVAGVCAASVSLGLAATEPAMLSPVLGLCGVLATAAALREDRRKAGYLATVLFVLALWVRLATWDVTTPEAYTLPVTVPALAVGLLHRRRRPEASSWTAYGPGLAATLLPSLAAAWADAGWVRPLLLGLAALALTLAGARARLLAPLVLGGVVLVLDALHELAPYLVQFTDALPRWVPPALTGLLLLAVGATYERRLRDARRLRGALARMR
ncbi:hypothetical protein HUT18_03215 [Streptomyces sp. NA04227]|uniref:SCO7613 C-terminal domain-containing membrane protein n=1 Tax=Streptomyces sp. NA04227 TaxID=2742136 RepID=UPI0015906BC2|nr:hypothetical protein [Streptomyces sp. NA04227]QKW05537.1 hypothetical protein HUT18_03215 [Streptomyces sp. NA04227]